MSSSQPLIRHARREGTYLPTYLAITIYLTYSLHSQLTDTVTQHPDVPAILGLIRELADYEKELQSVEATEATLLSTIAFAPSGDEASPASTWDARGLPVTEATSPSRPARCLLLSGPDAPGQVVGMALYFYNYSTWRARAGIYLEDLYVTPAERNKGYGKRLLVALANEVVAMNGGRLDWSVLKWNEPSIRFYEDVVGATRMEEWVGMRVDREALVKLSKMLD